MNDTIIPTFPARLHPYVRRFEGRLNSARSGSWLPSDLVSISGQVRFRVADQMAEFHTEMLHYLGDPDFVLIACLHDSPISDPRLLDVSDAHSLLRAARRPGECNSAKTPALGHARAALFGIAREKCKDVSVQGFVVPSVPMPPIRPQASAVIVASSCSTQQHRQNAVVTIRVRFIL